MDSWSTARGSMPTHQYEVRGDGRGWESLGGSGAIPAGGAMEYGVEMRSGGMTVGESPREMRSKGTVKDESPLMVELRHRLEEPR